MSSQTVGDTRSRIQQVALELFAERGYEKTSLREIAERLGVTKAALYYHFRTKEDIVTATVEDYLAGVDAIIAWAQEQPRNQQMRAELIRRYAGAAMAWRPQLRFFQQNPSMNREQVGQQFKDRFRQLIGLMSEPTDPLPRRIRGGLALIGLNASMLFLEEVDPPTPDELEAAAVEVALDLIAH